MSDATGQVPDVQTGGPRRHDRRGVRLSHLMWLVVAAVAVGGELLIRQGHQEHLRSFETPIQNLSAFHVITARDVRPLLLLPSQVPRNALATNEAVVGRVTLTALNANKPITPNDLGPTVNGAGGDLAVIGVPATTAMALDGHLVPGDELGVFVGNGTSKNPDAIVDLLSVTHTGTQDRPYVLIVSVPKRVPRIVVERLAAGAAAIVREPIS